MGNSSNNGSSLGIGLILFLIFLVLKLCKIITWSWWWVTAPLWGAGVIFIIIMIVFLILFIIKTLKK